MSSTNKLQKDLSQVMTGQASAIADIRQTESGQAIVEYILLLSAIVFMFGILNAGLSKMGFMDAVMSPIKGDFAKIYQYGHPKAKGYDDGGPENHPRAPQGGKTRIFINPRMN